MAEQLFLEGQPPDFSLLQRLLCLEPEPCRPLLPPPSPGGGATGGPGARSGPDTLSLISLQCRHLAGSTGNGPGTGSGRRRKQATPQRGAEPRDPSFRGVTLRMRLGLPAGSAEGCRLLITARGGRYRPPPPLSVCPEAPLDLGLLRPSVRMHPWAPPDFWLLHPSVRMHPWAPQDLGLPRPSVWLHLPFPPPWTPSRSRGCSPSAGPPGVGSSSEDDAPFAQGNKRCASCKTRRTPLWRAAENGTPLCNACGIRYKKYRVRCRRCWNIPGKSGTPRPRCPHCGERCHPAAGGRR
ncbi:GATA-type zinc finger protein 1 [Strix aluco]|uniref:GATA-type zinc finger protein 1 n=1 Tax=Strix aluco TaxID=111821 RepID=UPI003DA4AECB